MCYLFFVGALHRLVHHVDENFHCWLYRSSFLILYWKIYYLHWRTSWMIFEAKLRDSIHKLMKVLSNCNHLRRCQQCSSYLKLKNFSWELPCEIFWKFHFAVNEQILWECRYEKKELRYQLKFEIKSLFHFSQHSRERLKLCR